MSKILNVCGVCLGHGYTDNETGVVVPIVHYSDCVTSNIQRRAVRHAEKNKTCATCGSFGGKDAKLMKCSGCMSTFYCSPECQKSNWKKHKAECKKKTTSE